MVGGQLSQVLLKVAKGGVDRVGSIANIL